MGLTILQNNGVYQFSSARNTTNVISLIAGTDFPFRRVFYDGITLYTGVSDMGNDGRTVTIDNYGIYKNRGLFQYQTGNTTADLPFINGDLVATSSITSVTMLLASGSLYAISGSADHHFILPSPTSIDVPGTVIKIFKNSPDSNLITINPIGVARINNELTKSCSDPYCSVELISLGQSRPGWAIVSSIGTWT